MPPDCGKVKSYFHVHNVYDVGIDSFVVTSLLVSCLIPLRLLIFIEAGMDALCYYVFDGQTIGKLLTGIKVYSIDNSPLTPKQLLSSAVTYAVGNVVLAVDLLWGVLNLSDGNRCLHNIASNTIVLDLTYDEVLSKRRTSGGGTFV